MKLKNKILFVVLFAFLIIILSNSAFAVNYLPSSYTNLKTGKERLDFLKGLNLINEKYFENKYFYIMNDDINIFFFSSDNPLKLLPKGSNYLAQVKGNYAYYKITYYQNSYVVVSPFPVTGHNDDYGNLANENFYFSVTGTDISSTFDFVSLADDTVVLSKDDVSYPFPEGFPTGGDNTGSTETGGEDNKGDNEGGTSGTGTGGDNNNGSDSSGFFDSILQILENIANFCMYLNPFSKDFFGYKIVSGIVDGLGTFFLGNEEEGKKGIFDFLEFMGNSLNHLNPFSKDFIGDKIVQGITKTLVEFFKGDGSEENIGVLGFLKGILSFFLDFFENLLEFFIHIFVPTDEQWDNIKQSYADLGSVIKNKLPFVSTFQSSLENAQNQVFANNDFLNIKMPSFSFYGGQTAEQQVVNVRDAYEPYRLKIRSLLSLIVYGCGFVYCVKTVLNYNATASGLEQVQAHNSKGKGD